MKLLAKTSVFYVIIILLGFSCGGIAFYFHLRKLFNEEGQEQLYSEKSRIIAWIDQNGRLPESGSIISVTNGTSGRKNISEQYGDTLLWNEAEQEFQEYHTLIFYHTYKNQTSTILIGVPSFETDDLIETLSYSLLVILFSLAVILFVFSTLFSLKIWKPFFKTIDIIREYDLSKEIPGPLPATSTKEFSLLNQEMNRLLRKIRDNYDQLRSFTENASHELQTPLSSIINALDNLMQRNDLPNEATLKIHEIQLSALRLSRINESLLLLTRISSGQHQKEEVNLSLAIKTKAQQIKERLELRSTELEMQLDETIVKRISPELWSVVISNLFSNAMRHGEEGKSIKVFLNKDSFTIINSGKPLPFPESELFERFRCDPSKKESLGLGLALVKEILHTYNWKINHIFDEGQHIFKITFN